MAALALLAVPAAILAVAGPASADAASDAANALSSDHRVYVAKGAAVTLDSGAVDAAQVNIVVAGLPPGSGDAFSNAKTILPKVFGSAEGIVIVIGGTDGLQVASDTNYPGGAGSAIRSAGKAALADHPLRKGGNATELIRAAVSNINAAAPSGSANGSPSSSGSSGSNSHAGLIALVVIVVLLAGGVGGWLVTRRRREQRRLQGRRAEVVSLYDRLGADVSNLDPGEDKIARQALADASERYTATGSQLEGADTDGEYDAARRTALEGLQAARTVRTQLGLDPGPELPEIAPKRADTLDAEKEFAVGDRTVRGYPAYQPGAPYYFGGGGGYGSGWYSFPFWETMLIGSMLGGGFGYGGFGGGFGGGYGSGYDSGFDAGYDQAGGGSGGGGDWGGGGGDWGGGGGGGDWGGGGGGGDWGGGGGGGDGGGGGW
ncbi:MAG: hypothetical protein DLM56_05695 [Pseudonocardiales bacterium]|nr:MAG: hypothetical protein DLM56_05695 [Pseudonocardiales bacterium]